MADDSCSECGGPIRPTGGRSRTGLGPEPTVAWQPWRETGVCGDCGAVHRRVVDKVLRAWTFTGRILMPPTIHVTVTDSVAITDSAEVAVRGTAAGTATASGSAVTVRIEPAEAPDYGALGFLLAVFASVSAITEDAEAGGAALVLAWLLLTCPATRAAIARITRGMAGD